MVWSDIHYLTGLLRLGHDVYFFEDSDDYPSCYNPVTDEFSPDPTYGLAFAARTFAPIGIGERWAYYDAHTATWHGPCAGRVPEICATSDVVLNLAGVNPLRPWLESVPARALVDQDPAFTQIRHLTDPTARARAAQHTAFLSFGENIGRSGCTVPDDGLPWRPTRQPVVLEALAPTPGPRQGRFTTVMLWQSYPAREYEGRRYGLKGDSFAEYVELPGRTRERLELAVGGGEIPHQLLAGRGWRLRDSREPTRDLHTYERYVRESKAEFSVAKQGYVASWSGWFSERSCCYLGSSRPVVVQDTGFTEWLEAGAGVIAFQSPDEAAAGLEEIDRRYEFHCRTARDVVAEYFDSRRVIPELLEAVLGGQGAGAMPAMGRQTRRHGLANEE